LTKLFIEPHFGDVAWSCSGLLAKEETKATILCIFSAKKCHLVKTKRNNGSQWYLKKNEKKYAKMMNTDLHFFNYAKYDLRNRPPQKFFDSVLSPIEQKLLCDLTAQLKKFVKKNNVTEIYCPKASRSHIDHLLVKQATTQFIDSHTVYYYEDCPTFTNDQKYFPSFEPNLEEIKIDISSVIPQKYNGMLIFDELIKSFFTSKEALKSLIHKRPYEKYWRIHY
jgi:LmbE family N-acetylglucosaminyl deacetylase